jgi:hypothetical protein
VILIQRDLFAAELADVQARDAFARALATLAQATGSEPSISIGGKTMTADYFGAAPYMIAGVMQVNASSPQVFRQATLRCKLSISPSYRWHNRRASPRVASSTRYPREPESSHITIEKLSVEKPASTRFSWRQGTVVLYRRNPSILR